MSKRNLLNLVLFTFVLALIGISVFKPGKEEPITPPTLTNLKANEIDHILLKRQTEKSTIELIKKDDKWYILQPYQQAANTFRIDSVLKLLSTYSFSQNDLNQLNPAEFGLDKPVASVTFNKSTTIEFGNNNSLKNHRYVKIGSVLHMIADTFYYQLAANTESFIDHKLLPENSSITQLDLPTLKLKNNDGKWEATPGADIDSADSINQLIDEWQLSQAYDVKLKRYPENTKADIKITFKNNKVIRFKLNASKKELSLTNLDNGVSYILSADRKDKLLKLNPLSQTGSD